MKTLKTLMTTAALTTTSLVISTKKNKPHNTNGAARFFSIRVNYQCKCFINIEINVKQNGFGHLRFAKNTERR